MFNNLSRRGFLGSAAGVAGSAFSAGSLQSQQTSEIWEPDKPMVVTGKELRVKPVLMYDLPKRREATSWRNWGGIMTEQDVSDEVNRIMGEHQALSTMADFPLKILPLVQIRTEADAKAVRDSGDYDVMLVYAASSGGNVLESCVSPDKWNLVFVRHKSGPTYLWYEIVHCRFLRKGGQNFELNNYRYPGGMDVWDVVVDNQNDLLWRFRALYGLKNFLGKKIVALGGAGGWGCPQAPQLSKDKFKTDIRIVDYPDLERRIKSARADANLVNWSERCANRYLGQSSTSLETDKKFVANAFILYKIIKDYLYENNAQAFTILNCMSTVMPIAETTACLPLSLLNDEGLLAFCESDFDIIPSGILLHYICGKPVFLNDPTYPHHGIVTVAHCTSPRRMDGKYYEGARVVTHFESDYGATPKVEYRKGQVVTMIDTDVSQERWVGFKGTVIDSPFLPICRSQCDVEINGDWEKFLEEMRGFHWMMSYGDYVKEMGYAVKKAGLKWLQV